MAKQKKKRTKVYAGSSAAVTRSTVTKISAVNRGKVGQWWFDHKRVAKPVGIAALVAIALIVLIYEIIRLVL
jgi:hypothetical protein